MTEPNIWEKITAYLAENKLQTAKEGDDWQQEVMEKPIEESTDEVIEDQRLDCIYDDEPLGFEEDPMGSTTKMKAQDPLEEIDLGDGTVKRPTYVSAKISEGFKTQIAELLKEYKDFFAWDYNEMPGLKREVVELKLPIRPDKKPVKQIPRRFAPQILPKIKEEIDRCLKCGFIRPARYVDWLANVVPVKKKNGTIRVCINFRDLNLATPKDEYPMPVAEMLVDSAAGFDYLSMLDGYSGYNQIFIAEEDIAKTAFRCPGALGCYEWLVYIDDIVVKSSSEERHLEHLRQSFERMRRYGLKMNPLKCAFGVCAGDFLGFVVHKKGIEINQNKTKAIIETKAPSTKKELQSLLGKINFLWRFISNLSGKTQAFSPLLRLKKDDVFKWEPEHQKSFDEIKSYLVNPPVLSPLLKDRRMKLYIAASDGTIGSMLAQEDEHGTERAIYYLSRVLNDVETRYHPSEKLCLCLFFSCTKLKHYIKPFDVYVYSHFDIIKHMLSKPILHSRVGKWALALTEYSQTCQSLKAVKGQIVADFIVDHSVDKVLTTEIKNHPWKLYFNGSSHKNGTGVGIMIISPKHHVFKYMFRINQFCSNNEAEYEALITGLEIALELGAKSIEIKGDSELVLRQMTKEYKCVKESLVTYHAMASRLLKQFTHVEIRHIPRMENQDANDLAQRACGYKIPKDQMQEPIEIRNRRNSMQSFSSKSLTPKLGGTEACQKVQYLENPDGTTCRKVKYRALSYVIMGNELFKKTSEGVLLKCLGETDAYLAVSNTHGRTCGTHQAGHKMKWLLFRQGLYWLTMLKDCIDFAKGCQGCQKYAGIMRVPASELHAIIKPWPFRGWALDVIGEIKPTSSKGYRYILVGIDYFTKWIEAIPLKDVTQEEVISFIQKFIIYRFGIPETITTDQGSVFTGRKMAKFAEDIGFKLLTLTPYYAQANGQVEAANKNIIAIIKRKIKAKPKNWPEVLGEALWACRTSPKESTNTTPFRLTFGHDVVLPVEILLQSVRVQRQCEIPVNHYWDMVMDELIDLNEERLTALEVLARQKERVAKVYNKKVKSKLFTQGYLVWKVILPMDKKDRVLGKWSPSWEGPWQILRVFSNNAYEIEELNEDRRILRINGKYLKKYKPTLQEIKIIQE
ncbi:uncharacterized protein [Medicago truncatula]|uniref:uncharacterized protein n=1 Tax=Medicago truncatula TaxID=3880 RepID=UPI00196771A0|nr:uncharacterized protein LOC120576986 [Medicago truncatula]